MENSAIEWTKHTFNPWIGCTKVADECKHCYAETLMDHRYKKVTWGPKGTRVMTSEANWRTVRKWDANAKKEKRRDRVFCASLADVFEDDREVFGSGGREIHTLDQARTALFNEIEGTPNLIWLLLTKRPQNIRAMVPSAWLEQWPANVWTGTSAGCQATADELVPHLLRVPGPHFLSCEPMLGPVDLFKIPRPDDAYFQWRGEVGALGPKDEPDDYVYWQKRLIQWVICGGESGPNARPMHPDWARGLRDQCVAAGVPFDFKQWGEHIPFDHANPDHVRNRDVEAFRDMPVYRVGKKAAGRMLDGRTWEEMPATFKGVAPCPTPPLVYISGPITASTAWAIESNIRHAEAASAELFKRGITNICVHAMGRFMDGLLPHGEWLRHDFAILARCEALYLCAGEYGHSKGTLAEVAFAREHGILVFDQIGALEDWYRRRCEGLAGGPQPRAEAA